MKRLVFSLLLVFCTPVMAGDRPARAPRFVGPQAVQASPLNRPGPTRRSGSLRQARPGRSLLSVHIEPPPVSQAIAVSYEGNVFQSLRLVRHVNDLQLHGKKGMIQASEAGHMRTEFEVFLGEADEPPLKLLVNLNYAVHLGNVEVNVTHSVADFAATRDWLERTGLVKPAKLDEVASILSALELDQHRTVDNLVLSRVAQGMHVHTHLIASVPAVTRRANKFLATFVERIDY